MGFWQSLTEKLNPAQRDIYWEEGTNIGSTQTRIMTVRNAYEKVETVNRAINMLVDSAAQVEYDVAESLPFTAIKPGVRQKTLSKLLNHRPNPYMDISTFRRLLLMDFLVDGNAFIYFDGEGLYHIPAKDMEIIPDEKAYINSFVFNGSTEFAVNEIIHIKDNSTRSLYRGDSRINAAIGTLLTRESAIDFQDKFFDSGAVVGLVVETEQVLSKKLKERQEKEWIAKYNPKSGRGKPLILDAGMKAKSVNTNSFRDMDFNNSIESMEKRVCVALGIPPLLMDSGNNANIRPNLELFFSMTIIPMVRKFEAAFEYFFGYDIQVTTHNIMALRPDMKQESDRLTSLVNNGVMTGNEARKVLRLQEIDSDVMNDIRIPANVAGSATGVTGQQGGRPTSEEDN